MSGNLTNYLENALLEHFTGRTLYTKPTNTYLSLFTVTPTDSTAGTEVVATGFARQPVTWGAAANGIIANSANVRFPGAGNAAANYGTIVGIGLLDSVTAGNLLVWGALAASITINTGDNYTFATGVLNLQLD